MPETNTINSGGADIAAQNQVQEATSVEQLTAEEKAKIKEFRNNNIQLKEQEKSLKAELEEYKRKIEELKSQNMQFSELGVPAEELKEIISNIRKSREGEMIAKGQLDEVIKMRMDPVRRHFESKISTAEATIKELKQQLDAERERNFDLEISHKVTQEAARLGVQPSLISFVVDKAKSVWRPGEDGQYHPMHKGGIIWTGKDEKEISVAEWIETLKQEHHGLFAAPTGMTVRNASGVMTQFPHNQHPRNRIDFYRTHIAPK